MYWDYILAFVGIAGFILAGRKVWWAWYINIGSQFLWVAYALISHQYGFLFSSVIYFVVFSKNAYDWTRDRHISKAQQDLENALVAEHLMKLKQVVEVVEKGIVRPEDIPDLKRELRISSEELNEHL